VSRAAAVLALAVSLALAACGQSAEERFRTDHLRPLRHQMEQRSSELAVVLQGARMGNRRDTRAVRDAVQTVAGAADRLAALIPPSSVRGPFARYIAANAHLVRALRRFGGAMRSNNQSRLGVQRRATRATRPARCAAPKTRSRLR